MKKKMFLCIALCFCMVLSMGLFVACKDKAQDDPLAAKGNKNQITQGVFKFLAQANRELLIKFKADGVFYSHDMLGSPKSGKYVVEDAVDYLYVDSGSDMVIQKEGEVVDVDKQDTYNRKAAKVVKLFESDGTTPYNVVVKESGYSQLTTAESNVIAYDDDTLWNVKLGTYVRALKQFPTESFEIKDEMAVVLKTYMISKFPTYGDSELQKVQDFTFVINNNFTFTNGLLAEKVSGTYVKTTDDSFDTYTLKNWGGIAVGTFTVSAGANGIYYTPTSGVEADRVNAVEYADALKTSYTFTGTAKVGTNNIPVNIKCFDNGTMGFFRAGSDSSSFTGAWEVNKEGTITFSQLTNGATITNIVKSGTALEFKVNVNLGIAVEVEMAGEFLTVKYTFSGSITTPAARTFDLKLYSDNTMVLYIGTNIIDTGSWSMVGSVVTFDFAKDKVFADSSDTVGVDKAAFAVDLATGAKVAWVGRVMNAFSANVELSIVR